MKPSVPQAYGKSELTGQLRELASFLAFLVTGKHH
jgi:hypothetical protein